MLDKEEDTVFKGGNPLFHMNFFKKSSLLALAALVPVFLFGLMPPALAQYLYPAVQAATLGGVFYNICANAAIFGPLLSWISYAGGAFFVVQGVHHFRLHSERPANAPLTTPLMLWFGAMCLLALPSVVGVLITSINFSFWGNFLVCTLPTGIGAGPGGAGTGTSLDEMMINFIADIKFPLLGLISMISIASGLYMIVRGLFKASKYGFDPKTHAMHLILINMLFGAILMTIGSNMYTITNSVFGPSPLPPGSVIQWSSLGDVSPEFALAVQAALQFVQIIGAIAFVRGWMILKKVAEGNGQTTLAQGLTHILGGVLAINIFYFLTILDTTFHTHLFS